jgi:hypothetical protein
MMNNSLDARSRAFSMDRLQPQKAAPGVDWNPGNRIKTPGQRGPHPAPPRSSPCRKAALAHAITYELMKRPFGDRSELIDDRLRRVTRVRNRSQPGQK